MISLSQVALAEDFAISSVSDWQTFASRVNAGENDLDAYLTQDVDLGDDQTMVGTSEKRYCGNFDGRGHTLTVRYTATEEVCAPFRYVANVKITSLHVAGTINTAYKYAGGFVGNTNSSIGRIHNCRSSVVITSSVSGEGGHGGFIAYDNDDDIYMSNCLFDGSIKTTNGTTDCGGLIGFTSHKVLMYNCLYAPSAESVNSGGTFVNATKPEWITIHNSYYTSAMSTVQGTSAAGMSADELVQKLGTMWELVDGKPVPIMSQRPLSGNGTEASPYTISSVSDWKNFCANINNGESYSGKYVALMQDVDLGDHQIMAGMPDYDFGGNLYVAYFLFKGTFDGNNHTLTVNYKSADPYCAPFRFIESATIKNLRTAGTIETSGESSAGIVGGIYGNNTTSTIDNCRSSIVLTSSVSGEGKHGGIVGSQMGPGVTINIKNSLFDGKLLTTNGTTNCGGILGYVGWRGNIENSAYAPQTPAEGETPITAGSNTIGRYFEDNVNRLTLTNCYYGAKMETLQGDPIARSITGEGVSVTIIDEPQVTICGENFYTSGTQVNLAYSGFEPFNHYEVNNGSISDASSQSGTHTLTDIYGDVIISIITNDVQYYAAYDEETHTITFLGDGNHSQHAVVYSVEDFFNETEDERGEWQKAVFDASFATLKPQNATGWFAGCTSLKEIVGLENLNLSETYIMGYLFYNCSALTVLDMSKLDINRNTYKTKMLAGLNPECVLYVPSGMSVDVLKGDDDLHGGLVHESYNLVLDENGDGQYDCADRDSVPRR